MPLSSTASTTQTSASSTSTSSPSSAMQANSLLSSSAANFEYTTTNIPAFLSKLWTLVEDERYNELIAWDPVRFILKSLFIRVLFVALITYK